jgi:hypothetical protein
MSNNASVSIQSIVNTVKSNGIALSYLNGTTLSSLFTKNSPKNEFYSKFVIRYSEAVMTETQKNTILESNLVDSEKAINFSNGTAQIIYNAFFKNHILLINKQFAVMCVPSLLTSNEVQTAYIETLVHLFVQISKPQSILIDSKSIALRLFNESPVLPLTKSYVNMAKTWFNVEVQNELQSIEKSFVPVIASPVFFSFAPKAVSEKTPKAVSEKTPKSDEKAVIAPTTQKARLTNVQKMQVIYDTEKARINSLPKNTANKKLITSFDTKTVEQVCNELHQKSELKTASLTAFLNNELNKNA